MVYIKKLDKNIFPNYIPPLEEELFSSWLCRLAMSHDIKPITFIQNYFGRQYPVWNRDIDMLAPELMLQKMIKHTPLDNNEINKLFLTSLESKAFLKRNFKGVTTNIIPLGIKHRKRKRYGQLYCPICLQNHIPYYKKTWRLLTSLICVNCESYLHDRCPKCLKPITFFRVNMSKVNISITDQQNLCYCSECNFDLRKTELLKNSKPSSMEVKYQKFVDDTIKLGYNTITPYSFLFLKGIFLLATRVRSSTKNNLFRYAVLKVLTLDLPSIDIDFRLWNIEQRRETLNIIYSLLEQYPNKLNDVFERANITITNIYGEREKIPYWLEKNIIHRNSISKPIHPFES